MTTQSGPATLAARSITRGLGGLAALAAVLTFVPGAMAQPAAKSASSMVAGAPLSRGAGERPVTLERLPRLVVTLGGRILLDETGTYPVDGGPAGDPRGSCPLVTSSHTDASFEGGTFVVQGGFAENEVAAASYVVPAASFPVRFEMAEMIFATSGATVQTTTHWSIILYDGNPSNGTVLYQESSLEGILPPIVLSGTNGVNVQVVIDPGDPEQVFFTNAQGNGVISVGFRIDEHHNQTANPCFTAPPTNSNAFPVTDTSGLSQATRNWLFGVNCGSFGCPPNGGWTTFQNLNVLCRPTGDWVMRMTWSQVNCTPGEGACCLPSGMCDIRSETLCTQAGGVFQGDGTTCGGTVCPPPMGACCFGTSCLNLTQADCAAAAGTWLGGGTVCAAGNTCPTGACCLPDGTCDIRSLAACNAAGGLFRGVGTGCGTANCPQPSGACCLSSGGCLLLTQADCGVIPNSSWAGPGTTCADGNGNGQADACEAASCPADWNDDTMVNSGDISSFLTDWLASIQDGTLVADFNGDLAVNSGDISAFLTEWLDAVQNGC